MRSSRVCSGAVVACAALALQAPAQAGMTAFDVYGASWREIALPPVGPGSFSVALDALADGRLVAATGLSVFVETAVGSGLFAQAATVDGALVGGSTDPSFLSVSPDGSKIALGAGFGKPVVVFDASVLSTTAPGSITAAAASVFHVDHFSAAWADDSSLAIASGAFGSPSIVSLLDVTSDPLSPVHTTVVANIGGASGGVAFDAAGNLYTSNGFDLGPGGTGTGAVKAFAPSQWSPASPAPDFESAGQFVIDILSASSLAFDGEGDLFVGGGDSFGPGETGFLAVVRAGAVQSALAGAGPIDPLSADVRRLDPLGDGSGLYSVFFNEATGELYAQAGGRLFATLPSPGGAATLLVAALAGGSVRRRRCAA